jgi:hypothetical protein
MSKEQRDEELKKVRGYSPQSRPESTRRGPPPTPPTATGSGNLFDAVQKFDVLRNMPGTTPWDSNLNDDQCVCRDVLGTAPLDLRVGGRW